MELYYVCMLGSHLLRAQRYKRQVDSKQSPIDLASQLEGDYFGRQVVM
jgi:hypothetical protein